MADITERVQKRTAELLAPGETVIAALLIEPRGTYSAGMAAIAGTPRTATRGLARHAATTATETGGLAGAFPATSCVMAVTDRRVVVIPSNGLGMKEIAVSYERTELALSDNTGKGFGRRLRFTFVDDTSLVVDAQRRQPFERFAGQLG